MISPAQGDVPTRLFSPRNRRLTCPFPRYISTIAYGAPSLSSRKKFENLPRLPWQSC